MLVVMFLVNLVSSGAFLLRNPIFLAKQRHFNAAMSTTSSPHSISGTEASVRELKNVFKNEYASFFNPMEVSYYSEEVSFDDPMISLSGCENYQRNVDMLSARTMFGSVLFQDAGINLHSITGGEVREDGSVEDIITRWTLRFTFKVLPWQPTARFSGISIYSVKVGGPKGVQITKQRDFWDSINMLPGGSYAAVEKIIGVSDFINQLKPGGWIAPTAGSELPYELLRRGKGYEVRRYPSFSAVEIAYERRDEGFSSLGEFTRGINTLSPAIITIPSSLGTDVAAKKMMWPITFAAPGQPAPLIPPVAVKRAEESGGVYQILTQPESVIAVGSFADASVEPVVRRTDRSLREACLRDGLNLSPKYQDKLQFCQFDAIYTMGTRRGEVWVALDDDNPWTATK